MPDALKRRSELGTCSQRGQGTLPAPTSSGFVHHLLPWGEDTLFLVMPPGSTSSGWETRTGTGVGDRDRRGRWEDTDRHGGQGNRNKCGGQRESPPPPPCAAAARRALCRGCRTLHLAPQVLSPLGDSGLALLGTSWTAQACACVHVCGACAAHSCRACQGVPPAYTDADGVHRRQEEAAGNLGKGAVSGGRLCSAVAPACAPIS